MSSFIKQILSIFGNNKGESAIAKQIKLRADEFSIEYGGAYSGLDFTPQSLNMLDGLLCNVAAKWDNLSTSLQNELVSNIGSYILWMANKQFDGKFYWSQEHEQPVFVTGEPDFRLALMPMQKVIEQLTSEKTVNIVEYYKQFAAQADKAEKGADKLFA